MLLARQAALGYWFRVAQQDFSNCTLIILGHGNSADPDAAAPVYQHALELRRRKIFGAVHEAFWKHEPGLPQVLTAAAFPVVFIAPLFMSEGYFSERIIPGSLGFQVDPNTDFPRSLPIGAKTLHYCKVAGTHPALSKIVLHRASEAVRQFPFPRAPEPAQTSLIIAGHGTERDARSRESLERLVGQLRRAHAYADVHSVYLEEAPRISAAYEMARTGNLVIVPFFAGQGPHVKYDIPLGLGQTEPVLRQRLEAGQSPGRNPTEKNGKLVWYAQPVGTDPSMADIVLERVKEAGKEALQDKARKSEAGCTGSPRP